MSLTSFRKKITKRTKLDVGWAEMNRPETFLIFRAKNIAIGINTPAGEKIAPIDLPVEYYRAAGEQARKRVLAAGLRLGALLKAAN
jgi:hypothetical protein